jgi:hypothetical protein
MASATDNQPVRVNDREQLIYLLTEAAEVEHGLMCSYLYAAWSLKQDVEEGVTPTQLEAVHKWRNAIHGVAMEEMLHLALVNNLLMSIGSPPHFSRPNFSIQAGAYPASVVARLMPFTIDVAEHFVYLERPEGMDLPQAKGFATVVDYERRVSQPKLTPTAEDYDTISHLYRGIEHGFQFLAEHIGEDRLFLGHPRAQVTNDVLPFEGLSGVTDLASALQAISTIIEQGEGGRQSAEESHFTRFCSIRDEYASFLEQDRQFKPYRAVAPDPVMFAPIGDRDSIHISAQPAARVLDLANASYGLMLRLLASGFSLVNGDSNARRAEIDNAITVMSVVKALGILLTTLPANGGNLTAGMNFHLPRSSLVQPQADAGAVMLSERAHELADALFKIRDQFADAAPLSMKLRKVAQHLESSRPGAEK